MLATDIAVGFRHTRRMAMESGDNPLKKWVDLACRVAGISQAYLAEKAGFQPPHFSKVLKGKNRATPEKRARIAAAISAAIGRPVQPQDLLKPPPHTYYDSESKDSLTNVSEVAGPQRHNTEDGAVKDRVLRPIVQTLVQQFGLKAVMREVASVEEDEAEAGERPPHRRRTS